VDHAFLTQVAAASTSQLIVDDNGLDCPGGLPAIQEAVALVSPGATILVCPGTYQRSVTIAGLAKNGLKLIASGHADAVVLQGDYTERGGFHLENVSNVLIRGFTVRDFGIKATTETGWGSGNLIYLENAEYNTIEHNRLINGDMMASCWWTPATTRCSTIPPSWRGCGCSQTHSRMARTWKLR
jgi:hypothetical protein